ncbi:MAG: tetratricopeptide repeat protein [Candidatus Omnitrophota bacterium]
MSLLKKIFTLGANETYNRGIAFYNQGAYEGAIQEFEKITRGRFGGARLYPQLALFYTGQAHRNLGLVAMYEGRYDEAVGRFEKALSMTPKNLELHTYLGVCYNNRGLHENAVREFTYVVEETPEELQGYLRLATANCNGAHYEAALARVCQALEMEPHYADFHYLLGVILCREKDYPPAIRAFSEAVRLNPKYLEAYLKQAYAQAASGAFAEALETLRRGRSFSPEDPSLQQPLSLLEQNSPEAHAAFLRQAEEAFSQASIIEPHLATPLTIPQKPQKDVGFYNTLVQIYQDALRDHPHYADFHYGLGHAYHQLGRREEALPWYQKALGINPHYLQAQIALGYCYKEMGDCEAAKQIFEKVAAKEASHPEVFYQLALLLGEEASYARAIQLIEKALGLEEDLEGARETLGLFRKKMKHAQAPSP